ncbi:uncharacterized protein LOC106133480 [Amyelois transitella]|uniref:uncharacterized protein LOC106133480 n=1 Tax=Amyelois transitella TaxID=680683 RepID=UPI0029901F29|nr:uncharacterized protein LOC106133480 [Amyelois transitella]
MNLDRLDYITPGVSEVHNRLVAVYWTTPGCELVMMKYLVLICVLWLAEAYPTYPYYGTDLDTLSYGSSDSSRGGMVLSRYYNPYYNPRAVGGGMAAFMFRQPEENQPPSSQYYYPDRRRQVQPEINYPPPQQNEVFFPQVPEKPIVTEATEIADPTEKTELFSTTLRSTSPEIFEPEIDDEEVVPKPKKRVSKKKQVKRPVDDEDEEENQPKMPAGAYFPMFFGWGGRSAGSPGGATAIANAYSTGRGGVATSHATAYGVPQRPELREKLQQ